MGRKKSEARYYERVRTFLREKFKCVVESTNRDGKQIKFVRRGSGRLIVDVYGLRGNTFQGSRMVEGIAVEVKPGSQRTSLRHIAQAREYSRLAHRVYLAQPRRFDPKTVAEASRVGVGLLQITDDGAKLIAESRPFEPDPEAFSTLLYRSLRIRRCSLCGCYRFRYQHSTDRKGIGKMAGHWRRDQIAPPPRKGEFNKKVHFCDECEPVVKVVETAKKLQTALRKLSHRITRLER